MNSTVKVGRPSTIGQRVLAKALFYRTVTELSRETGASPSTVRDVLRRASDRGEIAIDRFVKGKSGRAMVVMNAGMTQREAKAILARMKSFDDWIASATPYQIAAAEKLKGSAKECFDGIRAELLKVAEPC